MNTITNKRVMLLKPTLNYGLYKSSSQTWWWLHSKQVKWVGWPDPAGRRENKAEVPCFLLVMERGVACCVVLQRPRYRNTLLRKESFTKNGLSATKKRLIKKIRGQFPWDVKDVETLGMCRRKRGVRLCLHRSTCWAVLLAPKHWGRWAAHGKAAGGLLSMPSPH